jgi:hypothetical protein
MRSPVGVSTFTGMRQVLGTVFIGVVTLLFSGCATDSSKDDHRVTKAVYIAKADAICARLSRADEKIVTDAPLADVLRETKAAVSRGVADLKALDRPPGHDQELDNWFHFLDREVAAIPPMQRAVDKGDRTELNQLFTRVDGLERKTQRAAQRFGFHDCAK